ncbi:MAG: hypothetical protein ACRDKZ_09825 [Actinomycetota bacterium]
MAEQAEKLRVAQLQRQKRAASAGPQDKRGAASAGPQERNGRFGWRRASRQSADTRPAEGRAISLDFLP